MLDSILRARFANHALLLLLMTPLAASADDSQAATGEAVYKYCKNCHGERGAGGEAGKYPRIAGLPTAYIDKQLHAFKAQQRVNKPMIPIFKHHRFDAEVIETVSEHIAAMQPPGLSLWPYQPSAGALEQYGSKQALAAAGATRFEADCAQCHGSDGAGTGDGPPLTDQYPAYLSKQIRDFGSGQRALPASAQCGSPDEAETEALLYQLVELGKG
jgi:cytochrome c553